MSADNTIRTAWSDADRRRYAEGDRLRASTVPSRRSPGPSADEWCDDDDEDGTSKGPSSNSTPPSSWRGDV